MFFVLWAAFVGLAAAGSCMTVKNGTNTSCLTPSFSKCVNKCESHRMEDLCLSVPGCTWNASAWFQPCSPVDTNLSMCFTKDTSVDCGNVTGCLWETTMCKSTQNCRDPAGQELACYSFSDPSECAAFSPCAMEPTCQMTNRCDINEDQNSCTATSGCFWVTAVLSANSRSFSKHGCLPCFSTPSHNTYLRMHEHVGQTCNYTNTSATFSFLSAVPSATGCDGGVPIPLSMFFWQEPLTCPSAGSPTSLAPSSASSAPSPNPTAPTALTASAASGLAELSFLAVFAASLFA